MLNININRLPDPDGHNPALLLKGDWLIIEISDGEYTGRGEASHSKDDDACEAAAHKLFNNHIQNLELCQEALTGLSSGCFKQSAIN